MIIARITLFLSAFCLIITSAYATDWENIIQKNEVKIYADLDSYAEIDGNPSLTTKEVFTSPQKTPNQAQKQYVFKVRSSLFNCKEHTIKDLKQNFYSKTNILVLKISSTNFRPNSSEIDQKIESLACQVQKMVGGT